MIDTIETPFSRLLDEMGGVSLSGALCVGRHGLFDPPVRGEHPGDLFRRHTTARNICNQCPALTRCRDWVESLPPNQRPAGVVAGTIVTEKTK